MAIVQISRITQRKGLQEDLPQPLAGAELGWSVDQRRLFIGNGTLEEGAPVVGNTEILTEFSDVLSFAATYTYKGEAAGYTVQTGPSAGAPITQSLQSRLDSYAIITDFGAVGDGVTDDTEAINRALFQIYCVQVNEQVRRALFFPAGVYKVSDTILIPPYARLYGDGADASIIQFIVETWVSGTAYSADVLVKQVDGGGDTNYYRAVAAVPALVNGSPVPLSDTDYWQSTTLPQWVVNTSDSLQQTGANIGLNGAVPPQYIEVEGMAFATDEYLDDSSLGHGVLLLDRVHDTEFNQVSFYGPLNQAQLLNATENLSLVGVESTPSLPCKSVTFDQCSFHNATYAFNTDQLTQGVTISNSSLDTLYQGILLGDLTPVNGGPTGVRIMHNTFDNIYAEGVVITSCSLNATGYNTFYDVGNNFNGTTSPATPCITIDTENNISVGDMFQRTDTYAAGYPRIQLWNSITSTVPASTAFTNTKVIQLGSYQRQVGQQATLTDGAIDQPLFTIDSTVPVSEGGFGSFRMDYTIRRVTEVADAVRTGTMIVVAGGDDSAGNGLVYSDDYVENQQTDVNLLVSESSNVITVSYTAEPVAGTSDGVIYYSISSLG